MYSCCSACGYPILLACSNELLQNDWHGAQQCDSVSCPHGSGRKIAEGAIYFVYCSQSMAPADCSQRVYGAAQIPGYCLAGGLIKVTVT